MSIGELAMLVNDNFEKPLNQQIRDMQYIGSYLFTASTTFTPDKSGYYKVIVVGAGGDSRVSSGYRYRGGSGGVAISTLLLKSSSQYSITKTTSGISFEDINATNGGNATTSHSGDGGIAVNGDFNYSGIDGVSSSSVPFSGVDVGVFIPSLMRKDIKQYIDTSFVLTAESGYGILGYGAGGGGDYADGDAFAGKGQEACVLIIPLELTE